MAGRYKAYSEYKDSGITWTGQVPSHWSLVRFKHVLAEKKKISNPSLPAGSISFGEVIYKSDETISPETKASYQEVLKGEFLVNPLNMNYDLLSLRTALSSIDVVVSTGYIVLRSNARLNPRYARWLLQEFDVAHMKTLGSGVRQTINYTDIGNSFFFEVPESEQKQIAQFLDHETGKIDALIEKQQALIALLKEKRQAVISHAVTKGLNPEARMKDSGVEWLGDVPEHWEVARLKFLVSEVVDCHHSTPTYDPVAPWPALRTSDISAGVLDVENAQRVHTSEYEYRISRLKPARGDVIYAREGGRWGVAAPIPGNADVCLAQRVMLLRGNTRMRSQLLMWNLNSLPVYTQLAVDVVGSAAPHVNISDVMEVWMAVPPIVEQEPLIQKLELKLNRMDALDKQCVHVIEMLQERRTALISAAVTGKIDVRDFAPEAQEV